MSNRYKMSLEASRDDGEYQIFDTAHGGNALIAWTYSVADAQRIVDALNVFNETVFKVNASKTPRAKLTV